MPLPEITIIDQLPTDSLQTWLVETASKYDCTYLLAHAEDGVIWGRFDADSLITSHDAFGAPHCRTTLRMATLWEARLFGAHAEVLLWQNEGAWYARAIKDAALNNDEYIVEQQMLSGDHAEKRAKGFTLLADGSEGLRHAVPIDVPDTAFVDQTSKDNERSLRPVRLQVRHYIDFDNDGNARIAFSRLVDVK